MVMLEEAVLETRAPRALNTELSLSAQSENIQPAYDLARATVEPEFSKLSAEGQFALTVVSTVAVLTRPLFANPKLQSCELAEKTLGKPYNPGRKIDDLAAGAVRQVAKNFGLPVAIRLEEGINGQAYFETFGRGSVKFAVCDEIDGTSGIQEGEKNQSSGIVVADYYGNFQAGAIASLVDQRVIVATNTDRNFYLLDDQVGTLTPVKTPNPLQWATNKTLRIASLQRRFDQMKGLELFTNPDIKIEKIKDMGGLQVLNMVYPINPDHAAHVMIDLSPGRGQPWFECIWPQMADRLGLCVRTESGKPIQYEALIRYMIDHPMESSRTDEFAPRMPIVICLNDDIYNFIAGHLG